MAAEGEAIVTFIFNGQHDIPEDVTHLIIHENITVIPTRLFYKHPNLVEVYCHKGVTKIEEWAFYWCRSLRQVILTGVTIVESHAFLGCKNLIHVECGKLERIGMWAFRYCASLSSINFPSAKIVEEYAFGNCPDMSQAIFGKDLESFEGRALYHCNSLESITIPLKNSLFTEDNIFKVCVNFNRVDLIEGDDLRNFTDALLLESWRNDMNQVLDSINKSLPDTDPGDDFNDGGKAIAIREWIESVLGKVTQYKEAHRELLNEASIALQSSIPKDAVINNVLPFIELPLDAFDWEHEG